MTGNESLILMAIQGGLGALVFFVLIGILKAFIKVSWPNRLLVITGRKKKAGNRTFGFTVERGRTTVIPYLQHADGLDLGVIPISVRVDGVNSANGITVGADATACVCIDDESEEMVYSAVERLMGKSREQIQEQIQQTLIGNFRGALNKATPLQAIGMTDTDEDVPEEGERAMFRQELLNDINSDLSSFGMKVVSVSLQKIWDTSNYIANLAQKTLAQKRQEVEIEEARLRARAEQAESDSTKRIEIAQSIADEKILEAKEKVEVYRQESIALIEQGRLEADNYIAEAESKGQKEVERYKVELEKLKNTSNIISRKEAEEKAAGILAEGEKERVNIIEEAKNSILQQKVELLRETGEAGRAVLFIQQQLPSLFAAYKEYASQLNIDSMLIMDEENGFINAMNRGPLAFNEFLKQFEQAMGINIKGLMSKEASQ